MLRKKEEKTAEAFWQEFEKETGEKVLKRSLGKYISGWDEFDQNKWNGLWGLIISTSGGFRFHHFPQYNWIDAFTRFAEKEPPKEKTIFIPKENIISINQVREAKWWKRIFPRSVPQLVILYTGDTSEEKRLLFENANPGSFYA